MKSILIVVAILFLLGLVNLSLQDVCEKCGEVSGNNNGVNEGASTSTQEHLHRCQRCEIQNYVNRLVFLMMSEDKNGDEDLIVMMNHRYVEMEAFYHYVNSYIMKAAYGNDWDTVDWNMKNDESRNARLQNLYDLMEQLILQLAQVSCTQHYKAHLYYDYNRESDEIIVYERQGPEAAGCLCSDAEHCRRERSMTTFPLDIPHLKIRRKETVIINSNRQALEGLEGLFVDNVSIYQIIPLATISRFFQSWLGSDEETHDFSSESLPQNHFNTCTKTLLERLKRSIQKIILVSIKKSLVYKDFPNTSKDENRPPYSVDLLSIQEIGSSFSWLGGNIFIGPSNRGPFLPTFQQTSEEAFDSEVESIIGQRRYLQLSRLYNTLRFFNDFTPLMLPFERLSNGFKVYVQMTIALSMHPVTQLNWDDWELRKLIYEELNNIRDPRTRRLMQNTMFYTTKKMKKRDPRSVLLNETKVAISEEEAFKNHWSDFITDAMKVSMEAQSRNKTLPWLCKIARLYDDFLIPRIDPFSYDCGNCPDFSEFLQREILNTNKWSRCSYTDNDVCSSWRNITEILNNREDFGSSEYRRIGNTTWTPYLNHMETIINWLSSPVEIKDQKEQKKLEYRLIQIPSTSVLNPAHKIGSIDTALCLAWTIVPTILSMSSDCNKL